MEDIDMTAASVAVAAPAAPAAAAAAAPVNTQFRTGKDEEKKGGEEMADGQCLAIQLVTCAAVR
jgi:ribosomal protein L12E/L44/L45/RPP1/RPP2